MTPFDESRHPRANTGQFRSKENDAPSGTLELSSRELTPDETAASVAADFYEFGPPEDGIKSGYLETGVVQRMMVAAIESDRRQRGMPAATMPTPVSEWQVLLADVNTMDRDEIRSLNDETLLRLDAYLLHAAARIQAARASRGLRHQRTGSTTDVEQLELVDYRNVTEAQVASAYIAGVSQGIAGGVLRTKGDFYDHAMDQYGEDDQEVIDRAWQNFHAEDGLAEHNEDGPSGWGWVEYQKWTSTVAAEIDKARGATA